MNVEFPTGKEFFESARKELGYTKENGYEGLLLDPEPFMGREADGEYTIEVQHDCRCDDLARSLREEIKGLSAFRPERVRLDDGKAKNWIAYVQSQRLHIVAQPGMER
jgi:hypothetical protein